MFQDEHVATVEPEARPPDAEYPFLRERNAILISLVLLAGGAWALIIWVAASPMDRDMDMDAALTMGLGASVFLALWIVMMIATMFPSAAPMILMFERVQRGKLRRDGSFVPTWIFSVGYLFVWTLAGAVAYAIAASGELVARDHAWLSDAAPRIAAGTFIAAGVYQITPIKDACLSKCRSPMRFVLDSWRDGSAGALRMGVEHGAYCLGCCWMLFAVLFPLGMMNVVAIALITLFIFAEKEFSFGRAVGRAGAGALMAWGCIVLAAPDTLPIVVRMGWT